MLYSEDMVKKRTEFVIAGLTLAIIGILITIILVNRPKNLEDISTSMQSKPKSSSVITSNPRINLKPTVVPESAALTYYSSSMGLRFNYVDKISFQYFFVREVGNKIYLYSRVRNSAPFEGTDETFLNLFISNSDNEISGGKWLEMFKKNSSDSLEEAIFKRFLTDKPLSECMVTTLPISSQFPLNFVRANITTLKSASDSLSEKYSKAKSCSPYVRVTSSAYFFMDKTHPDRFFFVDIGHDNIPSSPASKTTWDASIEVL